MPGAFLNEEKLKVDLQVSRTPIRDALGRLEQEGLIVIKPKKGILVSPLTLDEINQTYEIRMIFESYALRHYGDKLSIGFLLDEYKVCCAQSSEPSLSFQNDDFFHMTIVKAMQNHYVEECYETIHVQDQRIRRLTGVDPSRLADTKKEHSEIITACLKKDWEEAATAMYKHLKNAKDAAFSMVLKSNNRHFILSEEDNGDAMCCIQ